jgi:regulator of protease activity HflC (stomatin/prohibitin superfamily)
MTTTTSKNSKQREPTTQSDSANLKSKERFQVTSKRYRGGGALAVDVIVLIIVFVGTFLVGGAVAATVVFFIALFIVGLLSIRVINEWNRMAVLRVGKYVGIIGPGIYLIIPVIESTPIKVDLRVISTPFTAEKTLTKDNVPVDVDAILFWQVHDPENAILNVQNYVNSVLLASQTAMRDIIGKSGLSEMLAGRDIIGKDIQELIEERIRNWGIDAISVEIRDVKIPADLQNAMARVATSEREKQARVLLAESESLAADKMLEASKKYQRDPFAMHLRALNMMYEISTNGKNLIVFIPVESRGFSIPTPIGILGLEDLMKKSQEEKRKKSD